MENESQPLQEVKSDVIEMTDIEFKYAEFEYTETSSPNWFLDFQNQYSRFTAARDGRFVWRLMGRNQLMVIDLILGVMKSIKIVANADYFQYSAILCFTFIEKNWGLIVFDDFGSEYCCVAKAHLDMERKLLVVDYTQRVQVHNTHNSSCSTASVDWWPSKRVAIVMIKSLYRSSWCQIVRITQNGNLEILQLDDGFSRITPEIGPQIMRRNGEEIMVYKMNDPLDITVIAEQNGQFQIWNEHKWNSTEQVGFMNRYKSVKLTDSLWLFIRTKRGGQNLFFDRNLEGALSRSSLSYSFSSFNPTTEQFYNVTFPDKLLSIFDKTQKYSMMLNEYGILTVLAEKESREKGHERFAVKRVPLRKPEKLVNLAAIKCNKIGVRAERFPSNFVGVDPFE